MKYGSPTYFYILVDPRDKQVRYVGQTADPKNRNRYHKSPGSSKGQYVSQEKIAWTKELKSLGLSPEMIIIGKEENFYNRSLVEAFWIDFYRGEGHNLFNKGYPNQIVKKYESLPQPKINRHNYTREEVQALYA